MASLSDAVARPRVYINTDEIPSEDGNNVTFNRPLLLADAIEKQPEATVAPKVQSQPTVSTDQSSSDPEPSKVQAILDKLFGLHGQERYQLWPEKLARDALSAPHDVMTGQIPQYEVDPVTGEAHTSTAMIKAAQDVSALAGTGGLAGAGGEAGMALGSGPLKPKLVVARKMPNGEIQIGKSGQIHSDLLNDAELYAGLDKTQGQMGFASPDGKFLSRADALDYANKFEPERATDANAKGRGLEAVNYNTLLSDSSKESAALQANRPFYSAVENVAAGAGSEAGMAMGSGPLKHINVDNPYTTEAYHGTDKFRGSNVESGEFYSTSNPELADQFSQKLHNGKLKNSYGSQSLPLKLDTSNYHTVDAKGNTWDRINRSAIKEAKEKGADGVILKNVIETTRGPLAGKPQNVFITFNPSTVRSKFARFNSIDYGKNGLLLSDSSKPGTAIQAMANTNKPFYSAVENALVAAKQPKADAQQWLSFLKNQPGVKQEELSHLGLDKLSGPITKDDLLKAVQEGQPQIKEVVKGSKEPTKEDLDKHALETYGDTYDNLPNLQKSIKRSVSEEQNTNPTKYHSYQLPGGENYREMLLTLPEDKALTNAQNVKSALGSNLNNVNTLEDVALARKHNAQFKETVKDLTDEEALNAASLAKENKFGQPYKSSHWDEPNVLAHIRMNDRMIDGKKSLHLEEIQSDWMQSHRKELTNLHKQIDNDFDSIADRMVKAGVIKKVCD